MTVVTEGMTFANVRPSPAGITLTVSQDGFNSQINHHMKASDARQLAKNLSDLADALDPKPVPKADKAPDPGSVPKAPSSKSKPASAKANG